MFSLKNYNFTSSVYTMAPRESLAPEKLAKIICDISLLRKDVDVPVISSGTMEAADSDSYANIVETFENTEIDELLCTKFIGSRRESYENLWSIDQVNAMDTRELIAAVFQSIGDKLKK
jgi:hypothetical protein